MGQLGFKSKVFLMRSTLSVSSHLTLGKSLPDWASCQWKNVQQAIVVDIGNVDTHSKATTVVNGFSNRFFECFVLLIEVDKIIFVKVIPHIKIWPTVTIDIGHTNCESITQWTGVNA